MEEEEGKHGESREFDRKIWAKFKRKRNEMEQSEDQRKSDECFRRGKGKFQKCGEERKRKERKGNGRLRPKGSALRKDKLMFTENSTEKWRLSLLENDEDTLKKNYLSSPASFTEYVTGAGE